MFPPGALSSNTVRPSIISLPLFPLLRKIIYRRKRERERERESVTKITTPVIGKLFNNYMLIWEEDACKTDKSNN